jgi:hypothetical protein
MIEGRNGTRYLTAAQIRLEDGYQDVTPAMLRAWCAAGHLREATVGEVAAALGHPVPPGVDPAAAAVAGAAGHVYQWQHVVRAETAARLYRRAHGGRPRAGAQQAA